MTTPINTGPNLLFSSVTKSQMSRFQNPKKPGKTSIVTLSRLNPPPRGERNALAPSSVYSPVSPTNPAIPAGLRRNLRVHEGALRVNLRLGRSKTPVFMRLPTGLRLKHHPVCPALWPAEVRRRWVAILILIPPAVGLSRFGGGSRVLGRSAAIAISCQPPF